MVAGGEFGRMRIGIGLLIAPLYSQSQLRATVFMFRFISASSSHSLSLSVFLRARELCVALEMHKLAGNAGARVQICDANLARGCRQTCGSRLFQDCRRGRELRAFDMITHVRTSVWGCLRRCNGVWCAAKVVRVIFASHAKRTYVTWRTWRTIAFCRTLARTLACRTRWVGAEGGRGQRGATLRRVFVRAMCETRWALAGVVAVSSAGCDVIDVCFVSADFYDDKMNI